jgi:DNA-binding transcriptional regulator YiaG
MILGASVAAVKAWEHGFRRPGKLAEVELRRRMER